MIIPAQRSPVHLLRQLRGVHSPLFLFAALNAGLVLFFVAGIFLDGRYITGAPAWLKPTKFAVSISVYCLTLLWMLGFVRGRPRLVGVLGWLTALTLLAEMVVIGVQAWRGTTSHYNIATPLDNAMWAVMGGSILVLWLTHLGVTLLVLRQRFERPAFALALRLGLVITLIGMAEGMLMASSDLQALARGPGVTAPSLPAGVISAHSVGVADGGAGLPVVGWSTRGGDLRIGHFIGIHALQFLPLLAWWLSRRRFLGEGQRARLIWTAALGYLGVTVLVTWQALRAQPITAPDALTLGVFAVLAFAVALATALILRRAAPVAQVV